MRKLTIERRRANVSSLIRSYVYLEDPTKPDAVIDGRPCRLLGTVKNGETVTFEIPSGGAMLFITEKNKLSHKLCTEALPLFPGDEDIFLSGAYIMLQSLVSVFCLDGVTNEVTDARRALNCRNSTKFFTTAMLTTIVVSVILGVLLFLVDELWIISPKSFRAGELSVTLTDDFTAKKTSEIIYFHSSDYDVAVREYTKDGVTLTRFAKAYGENFDESVIVTREPKKTDGMFYMEGIGVAGETRDRFSAYFFEHDQIFYVVTFIADEEEYNEETVKEWASTVTFDE